MILQSDIFALSWRPTQGYGYTGARTDTTQQSGQTPDKEVNINHFIAYGSGWTEPDPTGVLSSSNPRCLAQQKVCHEPTIWPETWCS